VSNKGINFISQNKANKANNEAYFNFNNNLFTSSGADVFVKSNSNVNFTGLFNRKPLPKLSTPNTAEENAELCNKLAEKSGIVLDWLMEQPKYAKYFRELSIEPPSVQLISDIEDPKNYRDGAISSYNWAENTITINISYLPNLALISNGSVALVSRDVATKFIRNAPGISYEDDFKDLGNRSIGFALQSSELGKSYYYKLSTEETAELATQYLAQEMDRMVAAHVILNTENLGGEGECINNYYNQLKNAGKLPPDTTGFWIDTYPCEYKEKPEVIATYPKYRLDGPHRWTITPDGSSKFKSLTCRQLYNDFVATDNYNNHPKSLLELGSLITSQKFMEEYLPTGNDERERERLEILYQVQLEMLNADINERIRTIKGQR